MDGGHIIQVDLWRLVGTNGGGAGGIMYSILVVVVESVLWNSWSNLTGAGGLVPGG